MSDPLAVAVMMAIPGLIVLWALSLAFGPKARKTGEYVRRGRRLSPFWGERGTVYDDNDRRR